MMIDYIVLSLDGDKGLFLWVSSKDFYFETVAPHCRTEVQGAGLDPHLGGGDW